jgi:hypothetical protein
MVVRNNASYYTKENLIIKVAKWGLQKKYIFEAYKNGSRLELNLFVTLDAHWERGWGEGEGR